MKVPVITTKEFVIYLEEYEGNYFIHCDVIVKWTKEVKNRLSSAFEKLTSKLTKEIYANHPKGDKKHKKFLKMFGFEYLNSFEGKDNINYDVYVWR